MAFTTHQIPWKDRIDGLEDLLVTEPDYPWAYTDGTQECIDKPDFWFPEVGANDPEPIDACRACPFQVPCLHWAVHHEDDGIWAGVSKTALRKIRKHLGITRRTPETVFTRPASQQDPALRAQRSTLAKQRHDEGRVTKGPGSQFAQAEPAA